MNYFLDSYFSLCNVGQMANKLNVVQLVSALGGRKVLSDKVGITAGAIQKWEATNAVPPKHWPAIVKITNGGISYEELAQSMQP